MSDGGVGQTGREGQGVETLAKTVLRPNNCTVVTKMLKIEL